MIRRAIVWLCQKLEKPILKLTNKDYRDNRLEGLLTLYGSAYDVNIKIFNEDYQIIIKKERGNKICM